MLIREAVEEDVALGERLKGRACTPNTNSPTRGAWWPMAHRLHDKTLLTIWTTYAGRPAEPSAKRWLASARRAKWGSGPESGSRRCHSTPLAELRLPRRERRTTPAPTRTCAPEADSAATQRGGRLTSGKVHRHGPLGERLLNSSQPDRTNRRGSPIAGQGNSDPGPIRPAGTKRAVSGGLSSLREGGALLIITSWLCIIRRAHRGPYRPRCALNNSNEGASGWERLRRSRSLTLFLEDHRLTRIQLVTVGKRSHCPAWWSPLRSQFPAH